MLTARISELTRNRRVKVGLMLREDLASDARHASILVHQSNTTRFRFAYRDAVAGTTRGLRGVGAVLPDGWVRLHRQGDEFIGLSSSDGTEWTEVYRVILDLPDRLFVGVAAAALRGDGPISARLDELELIVDPDLREVRFRRGDTNADGDVNLTDALTLLRALFAGEADVLVCDKSADSDDSGTLTISDALYLLLHLFRGGPAPGAPFETCGVDPTADSLSCDSYPACE